MNTSVAICEKQKGDSYFGTDLFNIINSFDSIGGTLLITYKNAHINNYIPFYVRTVLETNFDIEVEKCTLQRAVRNRYI